MFRTIVLALFALGSFVRAAPQAEERFQFWSATKRFWAVAEPIPGSRGFWTLQVSDAAGRSLWKGRFSRVHENQRLILADDGHSVCILEQGFTSGQAIVRVLRDGRQIGEHSGAALSLTRREIERHGSGTWWDEADPPRIQWVENLQGPVQHLRIAGADGRVRLIDLETGRWLFEEALEIRLVPRVEPRPRGGALPVFYGMPYLESVDAPPQVRFGEPLELVLVGNHPNPGWRFRGFNIDSPAPSEHVLIPRSLPPPPDSVQPEVITPLRAVALVHDLTVGQQRLTVQGRDETTREVTTEVVPARLFATFRRNSGFDATAFELRLFEGEVARLERSGKLEYTWIRASELDAIASQFSALSGLPTSEPRRVPDLLVYELAWYDRDAHVFRELILDERGLVGPHLALVRRIEELVELDAFPAAGR